MELTAILSFLSNKSPEFLTGFTSGLLLALFIAYVYLLPKFIKSANKTLSDQIDVLADLVASQSRHIVHLEHQLQKLEDELEPYRQFAEQQLEKLTKTP